MSRQYIKCGLTFSEYSRVQLLQNAKRERRIEGTRSSSLSPTGGGFGVGVVESNSQNVRSCGSTMQWFTLVVGMSLNLTVLMSYINYRNYRKLSLEEFMVISSLVILFGVILWLEFCFRKIFRSCLFFYFSMDHRVIQLW